MAASKIKKRQIDLTGQIDNTDIATAAAIATSKLADGANFLKKEPVTNNNYYTATGILDMGTNKIINLDAPVSANDAARLVDVQNAQTGISGKDSVRVATTANITLSNAQTIDGVSVVAGDRVLVKNQSTASENGIWVCAVGPWTRATDANTTGELRAGSFVFVSEGTVNADSGWLISTDGAITIGTTAINWIQFSGAGQIIAGTGMVKTGNTIDVVGTSGRIVANADSIDLATIITAGNNCNLFNFDAYGRITSASAVAYITIAANRVTRETPIGAKNGSNTAFSLASTPTAGTEEVFLNGLLQEPGAGNDYTISGSNITMATAPVSDDKLVVCYFK